MPSKVTTTKPKNKPEKTAEGTPKEVTTVVAIAKATVPQGNGAHDNLYEDAIKEIVALSENDTYAKRIDNGPLSEARGKDTWRLHSQLRAVDQLDKNIARQSSTLQTALHEVDTHLHEDTVAVTKLISSTRTDIVEEVRRLAQATAGTEENLRSQTDSFSKAVENLLSTLQHEFDKKITAFQDEATRLIDKRFNQSDVAFAAIRADQEVIKALLTDIIKDRLGRSEPRAR